MAIIPSIEGQNNTMVINMGKYYRDVTTGVCSRYGIDFFFCTIMPKLSKKYSYLFNFTF